MNMSTWGWCGITLSAYWSMYTNSLDPATNQFLSHLLTGDVVHGGIREKMVSRAEGVEKGCQSSGEMGIW